jgi:hypothetical protein
MKEKNIVAEKSYAFAIRIVNVYKFLQEKRRSMYYRNNYYVAVHQSVQW